MGNELARTNDATGLDLVGDLASILEVAKQLSTARGLLPESLKTPGEIMAVIMAGRELGVPPMLALRSLHVVKGKVGASAELMLSLAARAGIRHEWIASDAKVATIEMSREGYKPYRQSFTMEDAKTAQLSGGNWQKYPAAMLRARAISAAIRAFCPDVLSGVYGEDEVMEQVSSDKEDKKKTRSLADIKKSAAKAGPEVVDAEVVEEVKEAPVAASAAVDPSLTFNEDVATSEILAVANLEQLTAWADYYKDALTVLPEETQKRMRKLYSAAKRRFEAIENEKKQAASGMSDQSTEAA